MKVHYIFAVATLVVSAACNKTYEQPEPEGVQMTIRAYQEGAPETKTTVLDGGTQVYWEPADEIKVFFRGNGGRFVSNNTQNDAVAEFSGTLNVLVGLNEGASGSNDLWGLYPYRADATSDDSSVTTTLPAKQTGRTGSFAKNTHITLACSSSHDLAFYNVTGGLRFSLTQEGIKTVKFEGYNGEAIAGKVKLTFSCGVPVVREIIEPDTSITLRAPDGDTFATGKWYYIEALPGTLPEGFTMTFYKASESAIVTSSSGVTITRGVYGSIANADAGLTFAEDGDIQDNTINGYEYVDLGLPSGLKWATCNVGANSPEEYGNYFAWGETEPKSDYSLLTYKFRASGDSWDNVKFNKYCQSGWIDYWAGSGSPDNKTVLDPEDDAASANWGDSWRMPTNAEWTELRYNCIWTWTDNYNGTDIKGRIVTSKKAGYTDKSIFLPAAGDRGGERLFYTGTNGFYRSSSLSTDRPDKAYYAGFSSDSFGTYDGGRYGGFSVRPVTE